jgi:tyrosine-protein kinase Etk/Wzc
MPTGTSLPELQEHAGAPPVSSTAGQVTTDEISLMDLLIVVAERKKIVLWVTAVFAILSLIISLLLPKRFTATVTLLPPQQSSSTGAALSSQLGNLGSVAALAGGSLGLKSPNDMYVAMFRSRTVENAVAEHFGLMQQYKMKYLSDAGKAFESHSKVEAGAKDGLIRVSVDDLDPRRAAELANGYVDQFRNLSQHLAITEAAQRRLFFEQQLQQAKDNLAAAEEALKQTQQSTGFIQPDSQARALIEVAAALRAQIAAKQVEIQSMRTFATSENSQVVQAEQELSTLRGQLTQLGGSEETADSAFLVPKGKVPLASLEYLRKLRDLKYYETVFEILARQFEVAKLDEAKQGAVIQVVDPAIPPDWRSFPPKRVLIVLLATIAGFIVGLFVALIVAGLQRARNDSEFGRKLKILRDTLFARRHRAV